MSSIKLSLRKEAARFNWKQEVEKVKAEGLEDFESLLHILGDDMIKNSFEEGLVAVLGQETTNTVAAVLQCVRNEYGE